MSANRDIASIVEYLQAHHARYDRATLRKTLLERGYAPEAVSEAEKLVYGNSVPASSTEVFLSRAAIGMGALVATLVVNVLVVPIAASALASLLPETVGWLAFTPFLVGPMEAIAGCALLFRHRSAGLGILVGLAISIAIAVVLIALVLVLIGVCFVAIFGG